MFSEKELQYKREESKDVGLWDRFINWLIESLFGGADSGTRNFVSNVILWGLVFVALAVVIWLLTRTEFGSFIRGKVSKTEFSFSDVEEDIKTIDFNKRIQDAMTATDFRLAVRWYYLKQLNTLNLKSVIEWQPFKTNIDYAKELKKKKPSLTGAFERISNIYDYVWYGKYDIKKEDFSKLEESFRQFEKEIQ